MSYVLTLVASTSAEKSLGERHIRDIASILEKFEIFQTCEPVWLAPEEALDMGISEKPNRSVISHIREICDKNLIDLFIVPVEKRRKKILLADMDSTIVEGETLDDLAEYAGLKEQISEITKKAMDGELDFHAAIRERVSLLRDLSADALDGTMRSLKINPGAEKFVKIMRQNDAICVLVSGGFTYFTGRVGRMLNFHHHHGNQLEIKDGLLTGKVEDPILDKYAKMEFLKHYVDHLKLSLEDCLTIGDGANDIPMLKSAGLGIGYKPKAIVRGELDNHIIHGDMTAALYAQGYTHQQVK